MNGSRCASFRASHSRLTGRASQITSDRQKAIEAASAARAEAEADSLAAALLQRVALQTQNQLRYHVTALGSMALSAIFPDPIELDLVFRETQGKTEAKLLFKRKGEDGQEHWLDPLEEDSGGACTVAGLGLRAAMREAGRPRTRPIIIMDEPGGHINDRSRETQKKFAEMIEEVGEKLGVQFLIVTMIEEIEEVGEAIHLPATKKEKGL